MYDTQRWSIVREVDDSLPLGIAPAALAGHRPGRGCGESAPTSRSTIWSMETIDVRFLAPDDVGLLREIDRSEQLEVEYTVEGGRLVSSDTDMHVPPWDPFGSGDHSVNGLIAFCSQHLDRGAQLLGAFDDDAIVGMAIIEPSLRPGLGWLTLLHVSDGRRRGGVGHALWRTATSVARNAGANAIYVSATPTGSAVQFYLKQGCHLAGPDEIVSELFELEPDDVHLICAL